MKQEEQKELQKFLPLFSLWIIRIIFDLKHFISITVACNLERIVQREQQQWQQLLKFIEAEAGAGAGDGNRSC